MVEVHQSRDASHEAKGMAMEGNARRKLEKAADQGNHVVYFWCFDSGVENPVSAPQVVGVVV